VKVIVSEEACVTCLRFDIPRARVDTKISLTLELLTPAFVGAAQPRTLDPYMPLRPSSVRGVLRFWFRTAAAALMWPHDNSPTAHRQMVDALRELESSVFGDTRLASAVVVLPPRGGEIRRYRDVGIPDSASAPGLRYLGYGLFEDAKNPPEALITRSGQKLTLEIGLRRPTAGVAELLCATVWLWLHFGGIGARSRRGFGSLHLSDDHQSHQSLQRLGCPPELLHTPTSYQELLNKLLKQGLDWVLASFREAIPRLSTYPLTKGSGPHVNIRTLDGMSSLSLPVDAPDGEAALEMAGRLFRDFRSTLQRNRLGMPPLPDYMSVKAGLQSRSPPRSVGRAAFGLPLRFYFRSLGGAVVQFNPREGDRLPSPLHFRVHRIGRDKEARHVVALFNLAEVNDASPLQGATLVQEGTASPIASPDGNLIKDFIDWAEDQGARMPRARPGVKR